MSRILTANPTLVDAGGTCLFVSLFVCERCAADVDSLISMMVIEISVNADERRPGAV